MSRPHSSKSVEKRVPDQSRVSVRRLTDEQLLTEEFRFDDPENIPGLNRDVPDRDANPVIIGYYDVTPEGGLLARPKKPFVRCCHCGKRRHWIGSVIRDDSDQIYIIGSSKCGLKHYGVRFVDAENNFKSERARQAILRSWQDMAAQLSRLSDAVEEALASECIKQIERKREDLRRASPQGFGKLQKIANSGAAMILHKRVRDVEAEQARDQRIEFAIARYNRLPPEKRREERDNGLKPEIDNSPIYKQEHIPLGFLAGATFFTDSSDVRTVALAARTAIGRFFAINLAGTSNRQTSELSSVLKSVREGWEKLPDAFGRLAEANRFFQAENLERLTRWSSVEANFSFVQDGRDLLVRDKQGGHVVVAPPPDLLLANHPHIEGLKYLETSHEARS